MNSKIIRVVGSCTVENMFSKDIKNFDKTGNFKVSMDDYGNWIAEYAENF